jgi:hypothetical protein
MTINGNKQVNVNGTIFSFSQFNSAPEKYMDLIRPLFRPSTLIKRPEVEMINYLNNLFCLMYYKKGMAYNENASVEPHNARRSRHQHSIDNVEDQILSALGIDIIKHNPKISKVMFKNSGNTYRMKNSDMNELAISLKNSVNLKRNSLDVSIGVELEFIGDRSQVNTFNAAMLKLTNGKYEYKGCYNKNDGKKWILGYDGSINRTEGYPMSGFELTSPILHFNNDDMTELRTVIDLIKDILHGYTNKSCGTHIHMSFACESATPELCAHFGRSYRYNEEALFDKLVPTYRRMNKSRWCRRTSCNPNIGKGSERYRKLNFANVKKNSNNLHLEFRQLDGTLDYDKIHAWIKLQKMFSELAMDSWNETKKNESGEEIITMLTLNDVITNSEFNNELEAAMKMAKLVA